VTRTQTLESLLVSANRLIRLAAQQTGNRTPSAVWGTLSILESDGAMRVGELAVASRISQPAMTRLLGTMEEDGLIARRPEPGDARAAVVGITAAGTEALHRWRNTVTTTLAPWFADLPPGDWAAIERAAAIISARTAPPARRSESGRRADARPVAAR